MFCPLTRASILPHARLLWIIIGSARCRIDLRSKESVAYITTRYVCVCVCAKGVQITKRINVNKPVRGMRTIFKYTL